MASGPAVFPSTTENTNYARLCRLLVDVGSQALRDTFDRVHSPATLHRILSSTSPHYATLQSLRRRKILNPTQWGKLYPTVCSSVSSGSFDITLLVVLLRNICGFSPPASTGSWDKLPLPGDNSCEANIARIKYYRNEVYAHASQASVDDVTFNMLWQNISNALLALGSGTTYVSAISRLKTECMDPDIEEHYRKLIKQWKMDDDNTKEKLDELKDMLKKWKSDEGSTKEKLENMEDVLKKWKSDEGSTKEKLENMEDMLKKWKSDEGSTKEKLENMEDVLKKWKSDEGSTKEKLENMEDMLKKWKSDEGSTKEKLENMEDMLKKWKSDEGSTKEKLENMEEMVKSEVGEVKDWNNMASGPAVFPSTTENTNYARLCRLLVDVGSQALRDTFDRVHSPATLHRILSSTSPHYATLQTLRKKKILNPTHWGKLYPTVCSSVSSGSFDITLLVVLLRNICGFSPPASTGSWDKLPLPGDNSCEANIARIKYYRNEVYAHASQASVDDATFSMLWQNISNALLALGSGTTYASAISRLKTECMDPDIEEHYRKLIKQWKMDDDNTKEKLDELTDMLKKWKSDEGSTKEKLENMEDGFGPADLIDDIQELYKTREGWLAPFPWCEEFRFHLDNIFTRLKMVSRKKERGTKTDSIVNMFEIFKPHEECSQPRKVLIEGQPGMGKTTYCNKVAYDWARNCKSGDSFPDIQVLLLLKCRDINSDLWEAIDDQLLPKDIKKEEREKFFSFVRDHQSKVLLVLDGLDELPTHKLPVYKEIIQGRMLPKCHLVVTARHEAGIEVRECSDTLLEVEGFTEIDAEVFIWRYFKTEEHLAKKLLDKLQSDASLKQLTANPLNTALLCLLCEDFQGDLPKGRTLLFLEIVACVLRRYMQKKKLAKTDQDPIEFYDAELKDLGCIALNGLLNDEMYFEHSAFRNCTSDLIPELGFLSVQPGRSKRRPSRCYGFLHKSFQEFFAAFYLSCQLLDEESSPDSLVSDTRYFKEFQQVLMFTCGVLAQRCETRATALISSIASAINRLADENARDDYVFVSLNCIKECEKDQGTFSKELAHTFGSLLEIQTCDLSRGPNIVGPSRSRASALARAMEVNSTLTYLNLSGQKIGDSGAGALAKAMERNSTLTELDLFENNISSFGAVALAKTMEVNSTLTSLFLSFNGTIGDSGAVALAKGMEFNSTLTSFALSYCKIGDSGAVALAKAMERNSTLTELQLSGNEVGDSGAAALAKAMERNSTLTELHLFSNEIGNSGAAALAKAVERNSTLTELQLSCNEIGDSGAAALAKAVERNSTLTKLSLSGNEIGDSGAAALAKAVERNSTLRELHLSNNEIGDSVAAALAKAMERNSTLT
ncbi:NLR family CARD domain-containing protein 3-like isoform X2 [Montipora foliosa]|uniref:NLR family CARD domain-containing protein 3-like isoform X2 n=1 Tax=Montipora foliosa TaxID=591990 RepID=UPI0035F1A8AE